MRMNELDKIIRDYLSIPDTDYAIMISGAWGCGKSYYITHRLKDVVNEVAVPKDLTRKKIWGKKSGYKIAHISLYGISSIEDFEYRVFCGINSWARNRLFRLTTQVGSNFAEAKGISTSKIKLKDLTFIDRGRILVFDDLERICEDRIPIKEVLGLINSYAEHSNLKVIIVCNEERYLSEKVESDVKDDYINHKEKSIRFTYSFIPNESEVYDAIVSRFPKSSYTDYLHREKTSILSLFGLGGQHNLRTLRFFLDTFGGIYEIAKVASFREQVVRSYLVSYMLYSVEYKRGCHIEDLESLGSQQIQIDTGFLRNLQQANSSYADEQEASFQSSFDKRYATVRSEFRPNYLLVKYIQSGYLDGEKLGKDIQLVNSDFQNQVTTPEGRTFQRLKMMEAQNDGEASKLIEQIMLYVKEDKYNLADLLRIYAQLLKYDYWRIEGFHLSDEMDQVFKESMERQKDKHIYDRMFEVQTPFFDDSDNAKIHKKRYDSLKMFASRINRLAKEKRDYSECQRFLTTAERGDLESLREYISGPEKAIAVNGMDWKKVGDLILSATNPVACMLCNCIIFFVPDAGRINTDEVHRIRESLLPVLDEYLDSEETRIRKVFISELRNHLLSILRDR